MKNNTDVQQVPKHRPSKNTRKWCKGKKGIEHKYIWQEDTTNFLETLIYQCEVCTRIQERVWTKFIGKFWQHDILLPEIGSREPLKKIESTSK